MSKLGTVVLPTSPPSLTMLWYRTTSSTGTVQKWSPGRHSDKPNGSKRHFGLGRPQHAWIGMQDPTNSATHGTSWFLGHVHRRVVNSQQDVNKMSNGHRNIVIRWLFISCVEYEFSIWKSCVDIGDGSSVEIVDVFCYLGYSLSVDGDTDAAVTARIHSGWFKLRSLTSFLTPQMFTCYCCEKFMMQVFRVVCYVEMRRSRWIEKMNWHCIGQKWDCLHDAWCAKLSCVELRHRLSVVYVVAVVQRSRLCWYGHVLRKCDDWVKMCCFGSWGS